MVNEPPRVSYVLSRYPVLSETFVQHEIEELERQGVPVTVFSLERPAEGKIHPSARRWVEQTRYMDASPASAAAGHLRLLATTPARYLSGLALGAGSGLARLTACLPSWAGEIRRLGIEQMHVHFAFHGAAAAMLLSRWLGIPYSVMLHASDIFRPQPFLPAVLRNASLLVTGTEYNRGQILDLHPCLPPDKVQVLRYSVPPGPFASFPGAWRDPGTLRVLSVGRFVPKKGHATLLEALGRLHERGVDFEARILGDGPLRSELKGMRDRLGLGDRVEMPGAAEEQEVREALAGADAFALPCTLAPDGDRDGLPVVLMEAMLSGLPVVTTDFIGIPELCGNGNTLLVPRDDPEALAAALGKIAAMSASDREELGERGRLAARRMHDPATCVGRMRELWAAQSAGSR